VAIDNMYAASKDEPRMAVERFISTLRAGSSNIAAAGEIPLRCAPKLVRSAWLAVASSSEDTARGPAAGSPGPKPEADAALRVLVVDDNEDGADMLAEALGAKGYVTRVAHDPVAALRVAQEFAPRVALLDIGLPLMDGYELAGRLRALPGLEGICLIALTGYGQPDDRRKAREAGFEHHLVKPIDMDAVVSTLRRCER
jgi:CheY-like chemotaxis protein